MEGAVHFIRGCVRATVVGASPEGLLNQCARQGLPFWNAGPVANYQLSLTVYKRDYKKLCALAERCQCRVSAGKERGLPRTARPVKRRYLFLAGALLCLLTLFWSSLFIWDFDVEGNESVSDAEILAALDECGVGVGTFWPFMSSDLIRCRALLRVPELSWLTVNVHGSSAQVIVREAVEKPEILDEKQPTDVIAEKAGIITVIRTYRGETRIVPSQTVAQGDLLVSGAVSSLPGSVRLVHGYADVYARTWYDMTAKAPLSLSEKTYTGEKSVGRALIICGRRINFYGNSGISGTGCDKIIKEYKLGIEGVFSLPVTFIREERNYYTTAELSRDKAALRQELEERLLSELRLAVGDGGEIVQSTFSLSESGGYLTVTLHAECVENIARETPIPDSRIQEITADNESPEGAAEGG